MYVQLIVFVLSSVMFAIWWMILWYQFHCKKVSQQKVQQRYFWVLEISRFKFV